MNSKFDQRMGFLYFISPFILWILVCLIGFIYDNWTFSGDTRQWSHLVSSLFLPSFFCFGILAILVRIIFRGKLALIWLTEGLILAILSLLYILKFG